MTHVVRIRILTFCLAILPAGIVFSLLLLFPLNGLTQTPSFSTHSFSSAAGNSVALHGDLNNDGYEDLIMSTNSGASRVYLSKGNGTYTALAASISASPQLLGDFNGDGKLDLIAGNQMYLGKGDGTFNKAGAISVSGGIMSIAAADVNHDGKTDLLVLTGGAAEIQVLFGNGDGTFSNGPESAVDNDGDDCCSNTQFLIGDFNGDGNIDAAVATGYGTSGYVASTVEVFSGDGEGNFSETYYDQNQSLLNLTAADVNGDGISDLVGTQVLYDQGVPYFLDGLRVYYGTSYSASSGENDNNMTSGTIGLAKFGVGQVAVADFNGDGIPDVAVFENACDDVLDCTLTTAATLDVVSSAGDVAVSSLESNPGPPFALRGNFDTKADLLFANPTSKNTPIVTLLNTTTGSFPTCNAPNAAVGIAQCSPTGSTASSPVNFAVGVAAAEPIRKVEVWVDRKKQFEQFAGAFSNYGFLNASLPLAAGSHRVSVIAYGWDNSQQSNVSTLNVTASSSCSAPSSAGVHICSPASGSSVSSPVQVTATATITGTIASTQLWVDGVKKYSTASKSLNTSITLAAGSHRFAVIATNTTGQKWESTVNATVK
jgi:FG-GAP-like repeat/Bacterial Ig domain